MKKRKTFVGMIMLIAVLVLGIGYAAISNINLNINGSANAVANADFKVIFDREKHTIGLSTNETITWGNPSITSNIVSANYVDDLNSNMTVVLDSNHRTASATFRVKNNSEELGATIAATVTQVTGENAEYFEVTKAFAEYKGAAFVEGTTNLLAGDTIDVTVTVTLKKLPVEDIKDQTFSVSLVANPVAAASTK